MNHSAASKILETRRCRLVMMISRITRIERTLHLGIRIRSIMLKVTSFARFAFVACETFALECVVVVRRDASRTVLARILGTRGLQV